MCACLGLFACFSSRKVATQSRGELGSPALSSLCALGLSGKEFEVEDLRSPARPQPFSQISCLTAYNCATPPPPTPVSQRAISLPLYISRSPSPVPPCTLATRPIRRMHAPATAFNDAHPRRHSPLVFIFTLLSLSGGSCLSNP